MCPLRASGKGRGIFGSHTGGKGATGIQYLEARDADGHLTMHRTAPPQQNYLLLDITAADMRSPGLRAIYHLEFPADWVDLGHCLNLARVIPKRRHHDANGKKPLQARDPHASENAKRGIKTWPRPGSCPRLPNGKKSAGCSGHMGPLKGKCKMSTCAHFSWRESQ